MQKYFNAVLGQGSNFLSPIANAQVTVLTVPGNVAATIYSDNGATVTANPLTTAADGTFAFYAANGRYTLNIAYFGVTKTLVDIVLEDDPVQANAAIIVGGTIDNTPIGATTPSTGAFTSLSASGTVSGIPGRLLNVQTFTSSGTYTPTTGTNKVLVTVIGGGGGGGGAAATTSPNVSAAAGGGGGAIAQSLLTSGFSGVTVTVGAAGTGGTAGNNNGSAGGNSSFGALITSNGGLGGTGSAAVGTPNVTAQAVGGGTATGGNIFNAAGGSSTVPLAISASNVLGSQGGDSMIGFGGTPIAIGSAGINVAGRNGTGFGGGGSGGGTTGTSAAVAGGNGSPGIVIIQEMT